LPVLHELDSLLSKSFSLSDIGKSGQRASRATLEGEEGSVMKKNMWTISVSEIQF